MGPSYYQTPSGSAAGYGNPYYSAPVSSDQGGIMAAVGYPGSQTSNTEVVTNPNNTSSTQPTGSVLDAATQQAQQQAAANAAKLAAFNTQNDQAVSAAGAQGDSAARGYGSSILDYLSGARQQQNNINQEGVQSELSKRQGAQGVLDYVHNGIQSGGVMLGNKNAGTSSATEALARAYSTLGQHQMAGVGTQYAEDQNKIGTEQTNLGIANSTQGRHNEEFKANAVAGVVSTAQQAIANIKANMLYANLPDQIDMQGEIARIQSEAQGKLNALDHTFSEGVAAINPSDTLTRAGQAQDLQLQGVAASNPYHLTTEAPATFQGGGQPAGSDLPIYTIPRSKQTA